MDYEFVKPGLTKREYAAIQIMQGLISTNEDPVYAALISVDALDSPNFGTPKYYAELTAKATMIYLTALSEELEKLEHDA